MSSGSAEPLSTTTRREPRLGDDRRDRAEAVDARHAQVHQHHVRVEIAGERDRLAAVERSADDLDPLVGVEDQLERIDEQPLVVGDQDTGPVQ